MSIKAVAKAAITARCQVNVQGWGQTDSVGVILELAKTFIGMPEEEQEAALADLATWVDYLVNPSACRQRLEDAKLLQAAPEGAKKAKKANLMAA